MAKDDRSAINPFTNRKHLDLINDDEFLEESYEEYYRIIDNSDLLDDTEAGKLVRKIAAELINAVEDYLKKIGRSDYTENYYDWEFHLINDASLNAWCMPGGKIAMYSGMFAIAEYENDLALVLGHEMAHALLDHSRTKVSAANAKNALSTLGSLGAIGLNFFGFDEEDKITLALTNLADLGSELFAFQPAGRNHEFEADKLGMMIMHWAGYDISDVPEFWSKVSSNNLNDFDFFKTHPADSKRIAKMEEIVFEINSGKDFYSSPVIGDGESYMFSLNCPNCNKLISKDFNFCPNCGHKIK